MMTKKNALTMSLIGLAVMATLAVALGGKAADLRAEGRTYIVPAAQIISFNDTVGRLDTATGAVYQLRGDLRSPSVRNSWELRVPAVSGKTSGLLEIQRATFNNPEAIFLVDVVNGDTWLLRRRGNENGTWDKVDVIR